VSEVSPSQARSRLPDSSVQGVPLACTFVPGACPAISSRAVAETRRTGRGPNGNTAAQTVHARASAANCARAESGSVFAVRFGLRVFPGSEFVFHLGRIDRLILAEAGTEQR